MSPARSRMRCRLLVARVVVLCLGVGVGFSMSQAAAQSLWELTPYRIQILLATGYSPRLSPAFEENLLADLLTRADAVVGTPWEVTAIVAPNDVRRAAVDSISSVTLESLPEASLDFDKVMLLVVLPLPTGYQVTARELDVRTQIWNSPASVVAWQAGKLRDATFYAVCQAFAPLAIINTVNSQDNLVNLRLRAAALPTRDSTFVIVTPGDLFLPIVRYNERDGSVRRISPVPWTFLSASQKSLASLDCQIHTGIRSPLTGRMRGRVERFALGVVPPRTSTRLILKSRTNPEEVLRGYDIYTQAVGSKATQLLGRTDWRGSVTIASDDSPASGTPSDSPLRLLFVKHGNLLLAKLPIVPGFQAEIEATVSNDDLRLEAEGYLAGLQEDLVDLVTRHQLLLVQIRTRLDAGQLDEAGKLLQEAKLLKTREDFAFELDQEQQRVFVEDPGVQRQIDAMFGNTKKLLSQYLDPRAIESLGSELVAARSKKP